MTINEKKGCLTQISQTAIYLNDIFPIEPSYPWKQTASRVSFPANR